MAVDTKLENLPEDILCGIFSRLPMKDAACASASCSTLLRAWRGHAHLVFDEDTLGLRLLPEEENEELFNFDDDDFDPHRKDVLKKKMDKLARDFVRFVDATLLQHRGDTALGTLTLNFAYLQQRRDAASVDRWVRFAIGSTTTRRLELNFLAFQREPWIPGSLCYDFPSSLLLTPAAMALEHLHLTSGCLRWPSLQEYINLTNVLLDSVRVTSQDLERFLCSCHKLQSLELTYCDDLVYVKVPPRLMQLGTLALHHCRSVKTVDLSDSHVTSLTFFTRNRQPNILGSVAPAPNVTRASFEIFANPAEPATVGTFESTSLARHMPGLESLSLRVWTLQVKVVTSPSNKYRHLKRLDLSMVLVGNSRQRDDFVFLHRFLDAAPALESLSLHVQSSAPAFDASRMPPGADYFRKYPSSPHLSLKTVTITGFDADLASLELLLYIMENARPLQRLTLDPAWSGDSVMAQMTPPNQAWSRKMQLAREAIRRHIAPRMSKDITLEVL